MAEARWAEAGGIAGLYRLLEEHGEAIEADLRQYYGVRLADLAGGRMTWRELRSLVRQLPPESRLVRRVSGDPEDLQWTLTPQLLAAVLDEVRVLTWQHRMELRGKKAAGDPEPKQVPRPGVKSNDGARFGGASVDLDEIKTWTAAMSAA